jgi:NAD(P)-dependent dehydrogenase (short-subunit alcohol dehydrogenase family)
MTTPASGTAGNGSPGTSGAGGTRVSVVTGGAQGLGAAIAEALARQGQTVVVADVREQAAQQLADQLAGAGYRADAMTVDVTREGEVAAMVDAVVERHGALHGLVCSAAIETRRPLADTTDDEWQRILDVNLKGPFLCMKHAIPRIAHAGGGAVVLLGSTLGHIGQPGYAAYCASKGALVNLAKQAAIEHAPDGVRVNVVSPSACDTGLFVQMANQAPDPQAIFDLVARNNPTGRLGRAEEVAATVTFLLSDAAAYISGTTIPVDGGLAARRI